MVTKEYSLKPILVFFVVAIIAISFVRILSDSEVANTQLSTRVNESVVISGRSGDLANINIVSIDFFGNASNNTLRNSGITFGAHINFSENGTIQVTDSLNISGSGSTGPSTSQVVFGAGTYNVSYTYRGDLYVRDAPSRGLLDLVPLFFVLLVVGFGIFYLRQASDDFNFKL